MTLFDLEQQLKKGFEIKLALKNGKFKATLSNDDIVCFERSSTLRAAIEGSILYLNLPETREFTILEWDPSWNKKQLADFTDETVYRSMMGDITWVNHGEHIILELPLFPDGEIEHFDNESGLNFIFTAGRWELAE